MDPRKSEMPAPRSLLRAAAGNVEGQPKKEAMGCSQATGGRCPDTLEVTFCHCVLRVPHVELQDFMFPSWI